MENELEEGPFQMISALRRKLGGEKDGVQSPTATMPSGVHRVDQELQRKFAKGVQYNSKFLSFHFELNY